MKSFEIRDYSEGRETSILGPEGRKILTVLLRRERPAIELGMNVVTLFDEHRGKSLITTGKNADGTWRVAFIPRKGEKIIPLTKAYTEDQLFAEKDYLRVIEELDVIGKPPEKKFWVTPTPEDQSFKKAQPKNPTRKMKH